MVYNTQNCWVLDFSHRPVFLKLEKKRRFGNCICFRTQVRGMSPTDLGPLLTSIQLLRLGLSEGPNWIGVLPPLTWGRKQIPFPKRRVFYFLEHRTTETVQNQVILRVYGLRYLNILYLMNHK
jgi:hypothetical protein